MSEVTQKVPFKEKFSYGFGDLASVLYWQTFMLYFTYFYTDVFLIPAGVAATMFLVSRIFDGINDPLMGIIADRTETKWGKFRPYLLWLCVPFAVMGVLAFTVPDFGDTGKLIWAYVTFFGIMLLYTAINIPYTALLGVISGDSNERTQVSSMKFLFAFSAGIIVSATLLPMVDFLGAGDEAQGWQYSFIVYGIAAIVFFLIAFKGTNERIKQPKNQTKSIKKDLFELITNKPWLILLAATITFILFVAAKGSVTVHYFKYVIGTQQISLPFWGTDTFDFGAITSAYNTIGQISSFIGVLGISWIARLIGKKSAFIIIFIAAIFSYGIVYFLSADQLGLIFLFQITGSITAGPLSVLLWAMYADTADYAEWKNGRRATGLIFSASTMAQKFGWAFGAFVALTLMSQVGFEPNQEQSAQSLHGLIALFSIIPACIGILAAIIIYFYPLSDKKVDEISAELEQRRKDESENLEYTNDKTQ
jgi:glycoside/pentoside/hexuronide:cation symporter, GPH family